VIDICYFLSLSISFLRLFYLVFSKRKNALK